MAHFAPPGPLGFGGAPLGNMFDVVDEDTAEAAIVAAWDGADPGQPANPPFVRGLPFRIHVDYSCDATRRSIEDSYQRLGRENARLMATTVPAAVRDDLQREQLLPADAPTAAPGP